MAPRFICICSDTGPNKVFEESRIKSYSIHKLISKNILEEKQTVWVHTPSFMIALSETEVPTKMYPYLFLTQKPTMYNRPKYYLYQSSSIPKDNIILYLKVYHNAELNFPPLPISLSISDLINITFGDLSDQIFSITGNSTEINGFYVDGEQIDEEETLNNFIDFESPPELSVDIKFSTKSLQMIQQRVNVFKEIINTEKQFLDDLNLILTFWQVQLKSRNVLTDSEQDMIFHDIEPIYKAHKEFYNSFLSNECNNSLSAASIFLEHQENLRSSIHYISKYHSINELINLKKQNRAFTSTMSELQQMNGQHDFMSYLITPIQRLPRYLLFIRELIKITPEIYPDYHLLPLAEETIEKINKEADQATKTAKQQTMLKEIEDKLKKYEINLQNPTRQIVMLVEITLQDQKKTSQAQMCLCNDIVFIYIDRGKTAKLIFSKSLYTFHYLPLAGEFRSIIIPYIYKVKENVYERTDFIISFSKLEEKTQFLDNIQLLLNSFQNKQGDKERQINWTLASISDSLPSICQHNCISNGECIIFYGGISTSQRLICSEFSSYQQQNLRNFPLSEMTTLESGIVGRRKSTFTYLKDYLYVIGGIIGSKEVAEIMRFDLNSGQWHQFGMKTPFYKHGHSCVSYKDKLYIFGGKSKENGFSSQIYILDPLQKEIEQLNINGKKPDPRCGHSAIVYQNKMYIFGGKNEKGLLNDLWTFDLINLKWNKEILKEKIRPQMSHLSFVLGNEMLIIGGITDRPESKPFTINLNNFGITKINNYGNFPTSLRYASGAMLSNKEIIIYGGMEYKSKLPLCTLYTLKLSNSWKNEIKNEIIINFDQNKWDNFLNSQRCHTLISHQSTYLPDTIPRRTVQTKSTISPQVQRNLMLRRASIAALIKTQENINAIPTSKQPIFQRMIIESIFIEKIDPEKLATFSQTSPRIRRKQNEKNEVMTPRQLIEEKISPESLRRYSVFPKSQGMRKLRVALKTDSNTSIISNDESESTDIIKEKIPIPRATFAQSIGSAESKRVKPVFTLPHNVQRPIPIFEDTEESSSVINDSTKSNNIITPSSLNDVQFINNENSPNNQNVNNNNSPNNQNVNNNNNSPNNQNINVNNSRTNTPTNNQNVNVNINTPTNNQNVNNSQMNTPTNNQNVNVINRQNSPRYNNSPNQHVEPKQPMLRLAPRVNNSELDAFPSFKPIVQQLKKKEADEESTSDNDEKKNERRKSTTSKRRNSAQPPTPINHVEPKTLRTANDFISEFYDNTDETFEFKQKNNNTNENNNNNKTEEEAMAGQWFATTRTRRSSTIKNPTILYQKLFVEESEDASSSKKRKRRRRRSKDEKSFHRHSRRSSKSQISLEVNSETEDANQEKTNANVENTEKIRPVLLGPIHARKNPKHQMGSPDRVGRRFVAENIGEMLQKPMSQIE